MNRCIGKISPTGGLSSTAPGFGMGFGRRGANPWTGALTVSEPGETTFFTDIFYGELLMAAASKAGGLPLYLDRSKVGS